MVTINSDSLTDGVLKIVNMKHRPIEAEHD